MIHIKTKWIHTKLDKRCKDTKTKDFKQSDKGITRVLTTILMIREFCNLIEPEAHLVSQNQEAKNHRYQLVLSSDVAERRILQSDWKRDKIGHTYSKVVISGATFLDN